MRNRLYYDEQDVKEIFETLDFAGKDNYSDKWDGTFVSKEVTHSGTTGETKALTGWDLDNNYGKPMRFNFVGANGELSSRVFSITNDELLFVDGPDSTIDYSTQWKSQLLKNNTKEYAQYLIAKYQREIKNLKDDNRKFGKKMSHESKKLDGYHHKNYDKDEKKAIIKNEKHFRQARLDNEEKISFYKKNINDLQNMLDSIEIHQKEVEL